jgi:DNA-damage-inducible protein J
MSRTATVRALMDPHKKESVTKILNRLGITHSEAINIFYSLIEEYRGFPFDLRLPESEPVEDVSETIRPEVLTHLKSSIRKNRRLGELLAR